MAADTDGTGAETAPREILERMATLLEQGTLDEVVENCRAVLARNPGNARAHTLLGIARLRQGDLGQAQASLERAMELNPLDGDPLGALGDLFQEMSHYGEAEEAYRRAISLGASDQATCLARLGRVLSITGRGEEAVQAYRSAIEKAPDHREALFELGGNLHRLGKEKSDPAILTEALETFSALRALEPDHPGIQGIDGGVKMELARHRLLDGDVDGARDLIRHTLKARGAPADLPLSVVTDIPRELDTTQPLGWVSIGEGSVLSGDKEWFVIDGAGNLLVDGFANANPEVDSPVKLYNSGKACLAELARADERPLDGHVLLGGSTNYYHWLLDYFPRLSVIEADPDLREKPLMINANLTKFQKECLRLAGIPDSRLTRVRMPGIIPFRDLAAPMIASQGKRFHPGALAWLRETVMRDAGKKSGARRVYFRRGKATQRRLLNETAVVSYLKAQDFTVVDPGAMKVAEQAAVAAEAEIIVAPHGAALTNVVFSPPGCAVIDLVPGRWFLPHYIASLSECLGLTYLPVRCRQVATREQARRGQEQHFDMTVILDDLDAALHAVPGFRAR